MQSPYYSYLALPAVSAECAPECQPRPAGIQTLKQGTVRPNLRGPLVLV